MLYKVRLEVFEGPFDLLVYLIESSEMSIYDIQISEITAQYMDYMESVRQLDAVLAAEFMLLASSLIEIKSKMLLPNIKAEDDEEIAEDPRGELAQKLLEYKRYKKAASFLENQEEESHKIHTKPREDLSIYTTKTEYCLDIDLEGFVRSFKQFLIKQERMIEIKERYDKPVTPRISVETRVEQLKRIFKRKRKIKFKELLNIETNRYDIVLTFLSMLELMRQKVVEVQQMVNFGEITLICNEEESQNEKGA